MALLDTAVGIGTGFMDKAFAKERSDQDWKRQKKVLQNQIQWKTADAKAAGIHPLYALGAPTSSYSSTVGNYGPDPMSSSLREMGQDIGRAVEATSTSGRRESDKMAALGLERAGLENDLLRSQIAKLNQPGTGPAAPGGSRPNTVMMGGTPFPIDPSTTPAQVAEEEFGEIGGELVGGANAVQAADRAVSQWLLDNFGASAQQYIPQNIDWRSLMSWVRHPRSRNIPRGSTHYKTSTKRWR